MSDRGRATELDAAALADLGRPFSLDAIRYKVLTKAGQDKKASAAFYMDARLVAERLNYVVGPEGWEDRYTKQLETGAEMAGHYFPVECSLSVLNVTKVDVGVYQRNSPDELAWKSAYSDAFKRVAVKFRVGAFLYAIPKLRVEVRVGDDGKVKGFTPGGEQALKDAYERWLINPHLNRFGEPLDHADFALPEGQGAGDETVDDEGIEFPETPSTRRQG